MDGPTASSAPDTETRPVRPAPRLSSVAAGLDAEARASLRGWLLTVAALLALMVLLGGATRLTDSGLSITEWRPATGILPPLGEEAWFDEFLKYQAIPEYTQQNRGMSIDEFKTIYWWEWAHRNLGRVIGLAFAVPLAVFLVRRRINRALGIRCAAIFALGAFQAWLGWYMVQSGLAEGMIDVSQYRLAAHLGLAFLILGAVSWTARDLAPQVPGFVGPQPVARRGAAIILTLIFLQVIAGSLVAGLRAGRTYNTWPLMDGAVVPDGLFLMSPWTDNLFENVLTVQFNHRMLAYVVAIAVLVHAVRLWARSPASPLAADARLLLLAVIVQLGLGVITLIDGTGLVTGLAHQAGALGVFWLAVRHLHMMGEPRGAP
jgi:cytochrome c oxidase assembly protein subunit 15